MPEAPVPPRRPLSLLERALRLFSDIRAGEGTTGLLLLADVFLVLAAYYLIKPVREGWLAVADIKGLSKMELKAYSSFGQSLLLLGLIPLYGKLSSTLPRFRLITATTLFFIANMVCFWFLRPEAAGSATTLVSIGFYLWVGIFAVAVVAQFWAFATDLYTDERGRRLFPLIAIGASAGASVGSWFTNLLLRTELLASSDLILVAILPLLLALLLTAVADRRGAVAGAQPALARPTAPERDRRGAYGLIFSSRYLLLLALLTLLVNWVNTNGENILYGAVQQALKAEYQSLGLTAAQQAGFVKEQTTAFYGNLFFWVNLCGLLLQAFAVSRLFRYGGLGTVLLVTPCIALFSYGLMALVPLLGVIKFMKILENSSDYSINNTGRHALWLPVPKGILYRTKAAVDTFFYRTGDGLAAFTVLVGTHWLQAGLRGFMVANIVLALLWLVVALFAWRENGRQPRLANGEPATF